MKLHKFMPLYYIAFTLLLTGCRGCSQSEQLLNLLTTPNNKSNLSPFVKAKKDTITAAHAPSAITRNIIEDSDGNIWFATFQGIIKYDGLTYNNITKGVSEDRFFSIIEDSRGLFWFGSIGGGVYTYDGQSFQHLTTDDGLVDDRVPTIYEDRKAHIWFGTIDGLSLYRDGVFENFTAEEGLLDADVNSIIEDQNGIYWLGTRGAAYTYDGIKFSKIITKDGRSFQNVRHVLQDSKDNIWMGGNDGLWRYDGEEYKNFTHDFVGYIYEDSDSNIWISSQGSANPGWSLSRYDVMTLEADVPSVSHLSIGNEMLFGIVEDTDGNIWVGHLNGVYRYATLH